jgi:hypothetical protein
MEDQEKIKADAELTKEGESFHKQRSTRPAVV